MRREAGGGQVLYIFLFFSLGLFLPSVNCHTVVYVYVYVETLLSLSLFVPVLHCTDDDDDDDAVFFGAIIILLFCCLLACSLYLCFQFFLSFLLFLRCIRFVSSSILLSSRLHLISFHLTHIFAAPFLLYLVSRTQKNIHITQHNTT